MRSLLREQDSAAWGRKCIARGKGRFRPARRCDCSGLRNHTTNGFVRYYNPAIGVWLSRDPAEEMGGLRLAGFTANDPINGVDGLGDILIVGAAVGAVFEIGMQITVNVATGQDWYQIDVKDVLISAAVGAVAPGWFIGAKRVHSVFRGTRVFRNQVSRIVAQRVPRIRSMPGAHEASKMRRRIVSKIRTHQQTVDQAIVVVGVQAAWQLSKQIAKAAADEIEEEIRAWGEECPPEYSVEAQEKTTFRGYSEVPGTDLGPL